MIVLFLTSHALSTCHPLFNPPQKYNPRISGHYGPIRVLLFTFQSLSLVSVFAKHNVEQVSASFL